MTNRSVLARRTVVGVAAVVVIAAAGCSSGDDDTADTTAPASEVSAADVEGSEPPAAAPPGSGAPVTDPSNADPPATDAPSTDPPATEPPGTDSPATDSGSLDPDLSFLWNDVDTMVGGWNVASDLLVTLEPEAAPGFPLSVEDLATESLQGGGDGFANPGTWAAGLISGTIDPGGEVSALVTTIDPLADDALALRSTSLRAVTERWSLLDLDVEPFVQAVADAFGELAETQTAGEQRFVPGPVGTAYSAVLTNLGDEDPGGPAVEIAVIPVADDEEFALGVMEILRAELAVVVGD